MKETFIHNYNKLNYKIIIYRRFLPNRGIDQVLLLLRIYYTFSRIFKNNPTPQHPPTSLPNHNTPSFSHYPKHIHKISFLLNFSPTITNIKSLIPKSREYVILLHLQLSYEKMDKITI